MNFEQLLTDPDPDIDALSAEELEIDRRPGGMRAVSPRLRAFSPYNEHQWGFIIPLPTGVEYTLKTRRRAIGSAVVEGAFIPLERPSASNETGELRDLLTELQQAHADRLHREDAAEAVDAIWEESQDEMRFRFEKRKSPDGYPAGQEGLYWVEVTATAVPWISRLEGEIVALGFPNSD